jgi:hypothetical protein
VPETHASIHFPQTREIRAQSTSIHLCADYIWHLAATLAAQPITTAVTNRPWCQWLPPERIMSSSHDKPGADLENVARPRLDFFGRNVNSVIVARSSARKGGSDAEGIHTIHAVIAAMAA